MLIVLATDPGYRTDLPELRKKTQNAGYTVEWDCAEATGNLHACVPGHSRGRRGDCHCNQR
jgi:hypothetical protein